VIHNNNLLRQEFIDASNNIDYQFYIQSQNIDMLKKFTFKQIFLLLNVEWGIFIYNPLNAIEKPHRTVPCPDASSLDYIYENPASCTFPPSTLLS
jgi:hypothetical protein